MSNDTTEASGRFVLRIDPALHDQLRGSAKRAGLSLNEFCARKLAEPESVTAPGLAPAVHRAHAQFGSNLVGIAAFGSWARGEMTASSDVDLLVTVAHAVPIGRALYRAWDEERIEFAGHPVEPCFVHLPERDEELSGFWAEIAIDGIILFDPTLRLSLRLAAVRRDIAAGLLQRRHAHGHSYWVRAA